MKLDFIGNINEFGDNIVRLYDFKKAEAARLTNALHQTIINNHAELDLATLPFIESRNCFLKLTPGKEDLGIVYTGKSQFVCLLTLAGYERMHSILKPFCEKDTKGYAWLYDLDTQIDFLFSPAGTW